MCSSPRGHGAPRRVRLALRLPAHLLRWQHCVTSTRLVNSGRRNAGSTMLTTLCTRRGAGAANSIQSTNGCVLPTTTITTPTVIFCPHQAGPLLSLVSGIPSIRVSRTASDLPPLSSTASRRREAAKGGRYPLPRVLLVAMRLSAGLRPAGRQWQWPLGPRLAARRSSTVGNSPTPPVPPPPA